MNGVALVLALALAGPDDPDFHVRKTEDDQLEYTLQIPPPIAKLVADGEEIHSPVPAETERVDRLCIRIGKTPAAHSATSVQTFRQLVDAARGRSQGVLGQVSQSADAAIFWPAQGLPKQATGVTWGWQPDKDGKLAYYVQIEPAALNSLKEGDELHVSIDPMAASMATFVVLSGNRPLPKIAAANRGQSTGGLTQTPTGTSGKNGPQSQPSPPANAPSRPPPGLSPLTGTGSAGLYGGATASAPASQPSADSALSRGGAFGQQPATAPAAAPPHYPDPSPPATNFGGTAGGHTPPQYSTIEEERYADQRFGPAPSDPRYNDPRGYGQSSPAPGQFGGPWGQTGAPPPGNAYGGYGAANDTSRTALQPPDRAPPGYAPPPAADPPRPEYRPQPAGASDTRLASLPPQGAVVTGSTVIPPGEATAAAKDQWWWPYWLLLIISLFLSIGVNLYLGWTTAEYYTRYRTAVDRLRSASRGN